MTENPFAAISVLNLPLERDHFQQILFVALRQAASGVHPDAVPENLPLDQLRQQARLYGPSIYLLHPAEIDSIFKNISLAVYRTLEDLYCSRLGRDIRMVARIITAMAEEAGTAKLDYRAIWAICLYLEERHKDNAKVITERLDTTWQVVRFSPPLRIAEGNEVCRATIACVICTELQRVVAFRIGSSENSDDIVPLAIYEALVSQRRPQARETTGLVWQLPAKLASDMPLQKEWANACAQMGIDVVPSIGRIPLLDVLHSGWTKDLSAKLLYKRQLALLFDNYLYRFHGYGPVRARDALDRQYSHLIGYNRDPAWQFPQLKELLPGSASVIKDGAAECGGLHYANDLLAYWPNQPVTVRRSENSAARAWVYLDGEILCEAMARELRRKDGTYRHSHPGR